MGSKYLDQTFETEVNSWEDLSHLNTQFVLIDPNIGPLKYSRTILDWNFLYSIRNQRYLYYNSTEVIDQKHSANLPTIHYQSEDDDINFVNAQLTRNPSDITFLMTKSQYFEWGKKLINWNEEFNMRLSNNSMKSYLDGQDQNSYWYILGTESLLTEPLTQALLQLKVCQSLP